MTNHLIISPIRAANSRFRVPGDKSISHRAVIFASLANGRTEISNFSGGEDNLSTVSIFQQLGISISNPAPGRLSVHGVGLHGLAAPRDDLNCGNSGTTIRLLSGLLSAQPFDCSLAGDESLMSRPMRRILDPLRRMGASIEAQRDDNFGPIHIYGGRSLNGIRYQMPMSSAQVKSCLLLAGMYATGETEILDPGPSRDHTELMLQWYGVPLIKQGNRTVIRPGIEFEAKDIEIPGDPSSAAFFLALGAALPNSDVIVERVCVNPTRSGFLDVLRAMGANVRLYNFRKIVGEEVADIQVRGGNLKGCEIGGELLVRAIDEFPIICVLAAVAQGHTSIRDAGELRVKETDRIAAMATELERIGVSVIENADGLEIHGGAELQSAACECYDDHRVAMALAIAGCLSRSGLQVANPGCIATSFPTFRTLLYENFRA